MDTKWNSGVNHKNWQHFSEKFACCPTLRRDKTLKVHICVHVHVHTYVDKAAVSDITFVKGWLVQLLLHTACGNQNTNIWQFVKIVCWYRCTPVIGFYIGQTHKARALLLWRLVQREQMTWQKWRLTLAAPMSCRRFSGDLLACCSQQLHVSYPHKKGHKKASLASEAIKILETWWDILLNFKIDSNTSAVSIFL